MIPQAFKLKRFAMVRLYWRTIKWCWANRRTGARPTMEEVTEWVLAESTLAQAPVYMRDIPGLRTALAHAEAAHIESFRIYQQCNWATVEGVESRRVAFKAMIAVLHLPVGDGRQVIDLGISGHWLHATQRAWTPLEDYKPLHLWVLRRDMRIARSALLSAPITPKVR